MARHAGFIVGCMAFLAIVFQVHGATDDFLVRTLVGDDTNPPSVPANLTATPIATSQINLSWATSTDDFMLTGYHVWRDNIQIATTSTPVYEDVELSASTTYTYYVTAFDSAFNSSASSTPVATTTFGAAPPPPTPDATGGATYGSVRRSLEDTVTAIEILPQRDSVIIRYTTSEFIRSVIKWGRTTSYELGSLAERALSTSHETRIVGLTPGTQYYFSIEGEDRTGFYGPMYEGTFMTLPPEDIFPPGNVSGLTAEVSGNDVILSWKNPGDPDFAKVRIVRSDLFYPSDTADGWVVYEGDNEAFRDHDALKDSTQQFYTVFTYDALGNVSSGAVVWAALPGNGVEPVIDPSKNEIALDFSDILFMQEGVERPQENGKVTIDGSKQLTIAIPYELLPEHLKTILVSIGDSRNPARSFKFILRVNEARTAYLGTLAPFGTAGEFPLQLSVFDFKTAQVGYAEGTIVSNIRPIHTESPVNSIFLNFITTITRSYALWFILLLLFLLLTGKRLLHAHW